jgi:hypothetical protein
MALLERHGALAYLGAALQSQWYEPTKNQELAGQEHRWHRTTYVVH